MTQEERWMVIGKATLDVKIVYYTRNKARDVIEKYLKSLGSK